MAFLGGLLGGDDGADPLDIYGDLFTDKQKAALKKKELSQGLFRVAEALGKAAQPSPYKPSIGSMAGTLGGALGAFGGGGDETMNKQLQAMQIAEKVRKSKSERSFQEQYLDPLMLNWLRRRAALGSAAAGPPPASAPSAPSANAPPGAPSQAPPPPPPGAPVSMGLPSAGMSPFGLPDEPPALPMPPAPPGGRVTPADYGVPAAAPPAGQQNTGLLSEPGGLDQLVGQDGQPLTGQGVLPRILASYAATGGTPGGPLPFQPAASTPPSSATPGADGLDVVLPSGPRLQRSDLTNVAAPAPGDRSDAAWEYYKPLIKKYESGGRNIKQQVVGPQGGYNPSTGTVTGPSSASGYLQMLDSTFRGGAKLAGIDVSQYPRAMDAPEDVQDAVGKALFKARGLADWAPYNKPFAAAVGYQGGGRDEMLYSGRGIPASALTNVADTGAPAGAGGATASGQIPGLGIGAEDLALMNMLAKRSGLGEPFNSLLETYYKSPGYLAEKARTEAQATKDVALQMDPLIQTQVDIAKAKVDYEWKPKIEEAVQKLQSPILKEREQAKADIERYSEELKQNRAASQTAVDVNVARDDLTPGATKMNALEFSQRTLELAKRRARGDLTVRPGDIISTPVLSPEQSAAQTQRGKAGEELSPVQVMTPNGLVTQQMTNNEIALRRKIAAERGPGGAPQIGDIVDAPALSDPEKKIGLIVAEDYAELRRQAMGAQRTIRNTHDLRAKLDSGMFTGLDANWNLFAAKLGESLGWGSLSNPEKVKNTEVYISRLGEETANLIKSMKLGPPTSDQDVKFAERIAGGQNLSASAIRELLDMRERYARLAIEEHNNQAKGVNPRAFSGFPQTLPMPEPYQQKAGTTPGGLRWKEPGQ